MGAMAWYRCVVTGQVFEAGEVRPQEPGAVGQSEIKLVLVGVRVTECVKLTSSVVHEEYMRR